MASEVLFDPRAFHTGTRREGSGARFDSVNPATGSAVASFADEGADGVAEAVRAARGAFENGDWAGQSVGARQQILMNFAAGLEAVAPELALLDSLEMGIPISEAIADVAVTAEHVRGIAALLPMVTGLADTPARGTLAVNTIEPRGVVGVISPWNFPLNQAVIRVAPALAMGNSVVLKPSEVAPLSALRMADIWTAAGLPPGVLEVLTGLGRTTGTALAAHPDLDHLAFTGSPATGAAIQAAAPVARSMAMELGGKSPQIVCESVADVAALAPLIARGVFWNAGQVCTAGSRLIVHRRHAARLIEALHAAAEAWVPGDPLDPAIPAGPIATAAQHAAVLGHIARAEAAGARRLTGDPQVAGLTLGVRPTIFDEVTDAMAIAREEVFGPVLAISVFGTRDEAASLANASGFGLSATVWTADYAEAHYLARQLRVGTVTIADCAASGAAWSPTLGLEPAGRSGYGADFGIAGLRQYGRLKMVNFAAT
jgi:acyl-CoA reductase-like NAD-dependent aldehyde dehydrogenase